MRRARLLLVLLTGCAYELPPDGSYYDDRIAPALRESCGITTSGCHLADERGRAMGNLDIGGYDALMRRQDVLVPYGPYPRPLLLLKASEPVEVAVDTLDGTVNVVTDIRHGGGVNFEQGSRTFRELVRWLDAGFSRTGAPIDRRPSAEGECLPGAGRAAGFSAEAEPSPAASYARFVSEVQPVLVERCGSGSCHGAPLADLRIACGETEEERRWNYWIAVRHLGEDPAASELLRRPLAPARGGTFHVGGDTFAETRDAGFRAILGWAEELVSAAPEHVREPAASDGYRYFVNRVQPMLVRKGCMALACHSPISVVFELRGGAGGTFSRFARERNYALARRFLALESPDPNQSRIVAKNLFPPNVRSDGDGIAHRGGSLLEDFAGRPARAEDCDGVDVDGGDLNAIPAYCVLARWHALERAAAALAPLHHLAWIERPPGIGEATDFDTYRPGADLRLAEASLGADGAVALEPSRSVLGACGLAADRADVRRPRASWDGARLAFAARASAAEPLRIYELDVASGACGPLAGVAAAMTEAGGILVHDLDPAYAPNGDVVFASTRGTSHGRPTRTPAAFQPNADLYVFTPSTGATRQLTFLLDQELAPAFMQDGRVIYTMEKREQDFHMLALRRQNLDGGDYHPLFASRGSLGFEQATDVGALPDGSFVFTAAALHATDGAGSIAVFNRSVGPDTREPDDGVLLRALTIPVRGAVERGEGAHRSPAVLPNGRVVFSCASDASATALDFDLCVVEPRRGGTTRLLSRPGVALLDAVALYGRPDRGILVSDGAGIDHPLIEAGAPDAVVHFNDFPMIQSLMFVNDRRGRPIDPRIGGFEVLRHQPPPAGAHRPEDVADRIVSDARGRFFSEAAPIGWVPLYADGSARMRLPGGLAISYRMTDASGAELTMADGMPFAGPARQREHEQYYPGERIQRSIPRRFFNTACGSCHGSVSGRELDVTVNLDVISGASINLARDAAPTDLMRP